AEGSRRIAVAAGPQPRRASAQPNPCARVAVERRIDIHAPDRPRTSSSNWQRLPRDTTRNCSADGRRAVHRPCPKSGSRGPAADRLGRKNNRETWSCGFPDVPKFASNSRIAGTPEENKAAVHGGIATFGKY